MEDININYRDLYDREWKENKTLRDELIKVSVKYNDLMELYKKYFWENSSLHEQKKDLQKIIDKLKYDKKNQAKHIAGLLNKKAKK